MSRDITGPLCFTSTVMFFLHPRLFNFQAFANDEQNRVLHADDRYVYQILLSETCSISAPHPTHQNGSQPNKLAWIASWIDIWSIPILAFVERQMNLVQASAGDLKHNHRLSR
jgi:hypothetical protein